MNSQILGGICHPAPMPAEHLQKRFPLLNPKDFASLDRRIPDLGDDVVLAEVLRKMDGCGIERGQVVIEGPAYEVASPFGCKG